MIASTGRQGGSEHLIPICIFYFVDYNKSFAFTTLIAICDFWLLSPTGIYSYRKCVCPASRSHRAGYPFTSKLASCSHRRRALVHIDSRERVGCSSCSHRELHPVGAERCTLSGGEGKKEKALISQDFSGLVVATGLEPVTPSM